MSEQSQVMLELVKAGLGVFAAGLGTSASIFLFLHRQERIKRKEELDSELRKCRSLALIEVVSDLGKCHKEMTRFLLGKREESDLSKLEKTFSDMIDALATKEFLLGQNLFKRVRACLDEIPKAKNKDELNLLIDNFDHDLEYWIPALKDYENRKKARRSK